MRESGFELFADEILPVTSHFSLGAVQEPGVSPFWVSPLQAVPMTDLRLEFGTLAELFHNQCLHHVIIGLLLKIRQRQIPIFKELDQVVICERDLKQFFQTEKSDLTLIHFVLLIYHPKRLSSAHQMAVLPGILVRKTSNLPA